MKATRILLFLSPLLYFMPPLVPVNDSLGLEILNMFYKGLLARFPANALMAFLCYTYAGQLGREAWPWVTGSLVWPFLAPLILAFMPPKYGSSADSQRRANTRPAVAKAAAGPFEARFPLLSAYLAQLPVESRDGAQARMEPVKSNFEFSAFVEPAGVDPMLAGAAQRQFTVWTHTEESGIRVIGAGMVAPTAIESTTQWLRRMAPTRKLATAVHPAEGPTKYFESYPQQD